MLTASALQGAESAQRFPDIMSLLPWALVPLVRLLASSGSVDHQAEEMCVTPLDCDAVPPALPWAARAVRLLCALSTGAPEVEHVIRFLVGDGSAADRERASDVSRLIDCLPQRSDDGLWEAARMLAVGQMVQLFASCRKDGAAFIANALEASLSSLAHGLKSKVESPETAWALLSDLLNAARPVAEAHEGAATAVRESMAVAQASALASALTGFCDAVLQEGLGDVRAVRAMRGIVAAVFLPHGACAGVATHLRSISEFHSQLIALPHLAKALRGAASDQPSDEARTELLALLLLLRSLDATVRADAILPLLVVPWRASLSLADRLTTRLLHLHTSPPAARVEAADLSWGSVNLGRGFEWLPAAIDPQRLELTLQHFPLARALVPERCACEAGHMSEDDESNSDASSDEIHRRRAARVEPETIGARGLNGSDETESARVDEDDSTDDDDDSDEMDEDDDADVQIEQDPSLSARIYDPSVVLASLNAALLAAPEDESGDETTGSSIAPRRIVESGLLSLALVALGSADASMRTVACSVLERFTSLMGRDDVVRDSSFRERPQILVLLDALRAGLSSSAAEDAVVPPRISCVVALCLARTAAAALAPAADMYSALNKWVLRRPALNLDELPLFFATFQVCVSPANASPSVAATLLHARRDAGAWSASGRGLGSDRAGAAASARARVDAAVDSRRPSRHERYAPPCSTACAPLAHDVLRLRGFCRRRGRNRLRAQQDSLRARARSGCRAQRAVRFVLVPTAETPRSLSCLSFPRCRAPRQVPRGIGGHTRLAARARGARDASARLNDGGARGAQMNPFQTLITSCTRFHAGVRHGQRVRARRLVGLSERGAPRAGDQTLVQATSSHARARKFKCCA